MTGVIVGAMLGFREVAASMLWMKTHSMWHTGDTDASPDAHDHAA